MRWRLPRLDPALVSRLLAALFCVYAAVAVPAVALLMPPFQAADELNHAERADQIASGGLVATRYGGDTTSGGTVDLGLARLAAPFDGIRFQPENKETRAMADQAASVGWGNRGVSSFPNTAIYPPFLYLPAALGLRLGRGVGVSMLHGLLLARLLQATASIVVAATAIALSGGFAPLLFALCCLPMTLSLFGSVSQDGPMIATAALASMLLARPGVSGRGFVPGCIALALVAMARPAYLPLCLLPLLLPALPLRARLAGAGGTIAAVLGWTVLAGRVTLFRPSAAQVAGQLHALSLHPGIWTMLVRSTLRVQWHEGCPYCRQFIGVLGWLDTPLPDPYYALTALVLLAALLSSAAVATPVPGINRAGAALLIGSAVVAVFALQYLSWSPIGGGTIEGVQGRYFLPLLPFLALTLPHGRPRSPSWAFAALCFYPALSIVVTLRAIVFRYYL